MKKLTTLIMLVIMTFTFSGCTTLFLSARQSQIQGSDAKIEVVKPDASPSKKAKEIEPPPSKKTQTVEKPEQIEEKETALTEEEAYDLAVEYWSWEPYHDENGELVTNVSTTIVSFGETIPGYYSFHLKWWVDDHWSTIDSVYVNKETGECKYSID